MKILIISYYFPPFNAVGAVRIGKFAKYLSQSGHDVKILTASSQPLPSNLLVELAEQKITRTDWIDINKPIQLLLGGKKSVAAKGFERAGHLPLFIKKLGYLYKDIVNFPDGQIGWYPFAIRAGKKILEKWHADFILASCSPPTSLLIAKRLSNISKIPWIADFRDLWSDNHNADIYESRLRNLINQKLEKKILCTASAIITVSDPLAIILKNKFDKPVTVIKNGYDLEDYPLINRQDRTKLRIVYTGIIHPIKRDPIPLFKALSLLKDKVNHVQIDFYGKNNTIIKKSAIEHGLNHIVNCYDTVSYHESLQHQVNADILLLLTYNSNKEKGVITTKFFEYLGARRPILLIGCIDGVAANIIKERNVGLASNDPHIIANYLTKYMQKEDENYNQLSIEDIQGFSRQEQAEELIHFLNKIKKIIPFQHK